MKKNNKSGEVVDFQQNTETQENMLISHAQKYREWWKGRQTHDLEDPQILWKASVTGQNLLHYVLPCKLFSKIVRFWGIVFNSKVQCISRSN